MADLTKTHAIAGTLQAMMDAGDDERDDDDWYEEHLRNRGSQPDVPQIEKPPFSYTILEDIRERRRRKQSQEKAQEKNVWRGEQRRKTVMMRPTAYFEEHKDEETATNGWQMKRENVLERVSSLFNNPVMSDVLFRVADKVIPAHKFMLASASPVFFTQFFETVSQMKRESMAKGHRSRKSTFIAPPFEGGTMVVEITAVSAGAFFEFLRYVYTDKVNVTLENMQELCVLADDYKVAGLQEQVMEYTRSVCMDPHKAFTVLGTLRRIFVKQLLHFWRDLAEAHIYGEGPSRPGSSYNDHRSRSVTPGGGSRGGSPRCTSVCSFTSNGSNGSLSREKTSSSDKRNRQMSYKLVVVIKDLSLLCWQAIERQTEDALMSVSFLQADQQIIEELLQRKRSSVPEVAIFRAIIRWTDAQCEKHGLSPIGVHRREVLGEKALRHLRFPAMTMEQVQWEVVPTGLLSVEDMRPLLHYKDSPAAQLLRFSCNPRDGGEARDLPVNRDRASLFPLRPTTPLLDPEDDEIDRLLASALFCNELRRQSEGKEGNRLYKSALMSRRLSMSDACEPRPLRKAEDFERLASGLYRYLGNRILRLCIEGGEIMVYDLGTLYPGEYVDVAHFSRKLARGKGTPLSAFL
eukprot:gnl/MRDRNA2_/MRDRNA2_44138_c0_seq1.p1 gnl/MRDRNA2_/MRDRNA2_44138_c0~~gnl/MRDRNA2_/MRDRNA2_44138_c0_seq1.p1  ORF type:complete len:632 (+),score=113.82 gnl/MRDRNA2_/MRDRNA2_44138_c0_seq1:120-2015(+)